MGFITYIAKDRGSLVSGHAAETEYTIEIDMVRHDPSRTTIKNESVSIGGRRLTVFHRIDKSADISTVHTKSTAIHAQMEEFFDSVAAGEQFTLDPYGTLLSPVEPETVMISGEPGKTRHKYIEMWQYSFSIRYV